MNSGLRILVPLDDSAQSQRVLGYAERLAAPPAGRLRLVRATDVEDETSFNSLAETAARLRDSGLNVESRVVGGIDAVSAIRSEVQTWHPDLVAMASTKSSGLDRWLNGSVTRDVVRSATVPVLVVPPNWDEPIGRHRPARLLVPLDGSLSGEHAIGLAIRVAILKDAAIIVMHAVAHEEDREAAQAYLDRVRARITTVVADGRVASRVVMDTPDRAILNTARELGAEAIIMAARPHRRGTAVAVFENATVPLVVAPPGTRTNVAAIKLGAHVRASDDLLAGEVHRIVVDLDQRALTGVVVLTTGQLSREILVPFDFIESADAHDIRLRCSREEIHALPDFAFNEVATPPQTWTSIVAGPQHKRLGPAQQDITRGTRVVAPDGEIVHITGVESDLATGHLSAFTVRPDGVLSREFRLPVESVHAQNS